MLFIKTYSLTYPHAQRYYRKYYNLWFHDPSNKTYTEAGNLYGPRTEKMLEWISLSWEALPGSLIQESFLLCGVGSEINQFNMYLRELLENGKIKFLVLYKYIYL